MPFSTGSPVEETFEDVPFDELSDAESVDEDVVPQQKIEIDNKVCNLPM